MKNQGRRISLGILLMCLTAAFLTACGGASGDTSASFDNTKAEVSNAEAGVNTYSMLSEDVEMEAADLEEISDDYNTGQAANTERKLIRTVDMNVETENYDQLTSNLESRIAELGGYIEYKEAYYGSQYYSGNRSASLRARIPADKLEEFTGQVREAANVTRENESVEDVTLTYVDLESHKKMLITQQERLMELLEQAETIEDIIALESRLSEVRYQIESMESQLRTYDNLVDYSTVNLYIEEVERYTPQPKKGSLERIQTGFLENVYQVINGISNFFIELIISLPILMVWIILILLLILVVRMVKKRRKKRKAEAFEGVQKNDGKQ